MAALTEQDLRNAAGHLNEVVEKRTELATRINNSADSARLSRHAFLIAAHAVRTERLSLPEIVALLNSAELFVDHQWSERSLRRAVRLAKSMADAVRAVDPATFGEPGITVTVTAGAVDPDEPDPGTDFDFET